MKFQINKNGRTVILENEEVICCRCKVKKKGLYEKWYYYDNKFDRGLYCRDCATGNFEINIDDEIDNYFWLVDSFKIEGEQ